jgi:hypothetical protein
LCIECQIPAKAKTHIFGRLCARRKLVLPSIDLEGLSCRHSGFLGMFMAHIQDGASSYLEALHGDWVWTGEDSALRSEVSCATYGPA